MDRIAVALRDIPLETVKSHSKSLTVDTGGI